jgi:hypothetical protein
VSTARLAARMRRLEAVAGVDGPHEHPLKLCLLGSDSEPSEAWLAQQATCSGCESPGVTRLVVWPPETWESW